MRAVAAIAGSEIRERRIWSVAALLVGLVPLLLWPMAPGRDPEVVRWSAGVLFGVTAAVLTIVCGASVMAGDWSRGTFGFLLARPVRWTTIWLGKLTAALLLVSLSALVLLPARLAVGPLGVLPGRRVVLGLGLILIGLVFAQGAAIGQRSRSPLPAVDLLAAIVIGYVGTETLYLFFFAFGGAPGFFEAVAAVAIGAVALAACAASAAAFGWAGVNVRRAHVAFSTTLWSLLACLTLVAATWVHWAIRPRAEAFASVRSAAVGPLGRWALVIGQAQGRPQEQEALFFVPPDGRAPTLVGRSGFRTWALAFAENGRAAAWWEVASGLPLRERIRYARSDGERVETSPLSFRAPLGGGGALALSPTGERLAILQDDRVSIVAVPSDRVVATIRLPFPLEVQTTSFVGESTLIVLGQRSASADFEVLRIEVGGGHVTVAGPLRVGNAAARFAVDGSGRRILAHVTSPAERSLRLFDASSGRAIATLWSGNGLADARFLDGGRIAMIEASRGSSRLHVFTEEGHDERLLDVPGDGRSIDEAPGYLLIGTSTDTVVVDATTLTVTRRLPGLHAVPYGRIDLHREGSGGAGLLLDEQGRLVRADVETGAWRTVIGRRP